MLHYFWVYCQKENVTQVSSSPLRPFTGNVLQKAFCRISLVCPWIRLQARPFLAHIMPTLKLEQVTLPHSDPGDVDIWSRENGSLSLYIRPGVRQTEDGDYETLGLPYGVYPRLIMAWICTQVTKHGRRRLDFGKSLQSFMRDLGVTPSGGEHGTRGRFQNQMRRLFAAQIGMIWRVGPDEKSGVLQ
jgi:hypothetical protein